MRGHRLTLIALALFASTNALAQPDSMMLELCVNGACYGTAFVLVRDQHILVDADALKRAKVPLQNVAERMIGAKTFVDVSAYAHGSTVQLDVNAGQLTLTLSADAFDSHRLDLNPRAALLAPSAVPSGFVNYAINVGSERSATSTYLDAGFAYGRGLLRDNPSWNRLQGFSRGMTRFEYDDIRHLRRWTVGDQYAFSTDGLGGTVLLGGAGVVRAFDLDPYLITFPQPTLSGLLQAPGTVDIYKNGVLVGQQQVGAGAFNLANLGVGPGTNDVKVVVHDPFGGTRVLQQKFYATSQNLAQGLDEFAFQAGVERRSTLDNGYESGRGVLLARQRHGFTSWLTAGYRIEAQNHLVNAGPSIDLRLPFGFASAAFAASNDHGNAGQGASLSYQFVAREFSFGFGTQHFSSGYRRLGDDLVPDDFRLRRVSYLNASWSPVTRLSVQLNAGDLVYASGMRQRNLGVTSAIDLPGDASLMINLNRQVNHPGDSDNQVLVNLVVPLGRRDSISFNASHSDNAGSGYGFSAQRSVPTDNGWGYSLDARRDDYGVNGRAEADYQGHYGLVSMTGQRFGNQSSANVLVSGSVLALGGQVHAGRVLQNGYALVQTPGVSNVEITRENLPVGKTDTEGNLLVTNLLPYQANKIGIDQGSVPLEYQLDDTEKMMSVPRLGGTIVRFGVHALHGARGKLTLDGKTVQYGSATVMWEDKRMKTLVGLDGSFYFPDLPSGNYTLQAHTAEGHMNCHLAMPQSSRPMVDLGKIACTRDNGAHP